MNKRENRVIFLIGVLGVFISSLLLFSDKIYSIPIHDTFFHTQRIMSIKNALENGQFPVRIYSEIYNGYGYGSPLFYPEAFLYFPAVLCLIGVPLVTSYNIFLIVMNAVTMWIAYYSYKTIMKSPMLGVMAALLYQISVYRLLDLYTRAAIGEFLALTFCPLVLCGLTLMKRGEYGKWWVLTLAFSGLMQSHILSFALMCVVSVVYALIHWKDFLKKDAILAVLKAVGVTILLNAWFLIPFLQVSHLEVSAFRVKEDFWYTDAALVQLFDVLNLTAGSIEYYGTAGIAHTMTKTPGIFLLIGTILLVFAIALYSDSFGENKKRIYGYLTAGVISTLMITELFPWELVRKIGILERFFQNYRLMWRFNILATLFLSIAAAYGFYYFFVRASAEKYKSVVLVCVVASVFSLLYINQFVKQSGEYDNQQAIQNGYMDELYVLGQYNFNGNGEVGSNQASMQYLKIDRGSSRVDVEFTYDINEVREESPYIEVPLTYYPGYRAYVNGDKAELTYNWAGIIKVYLPEGVSSGQLSVVYEDYGIVKLANWVSMLTILALVGGVSYRYASKPKNEEEASPETETTATEDGAEPVDEVPEDTVQELTEEAQEVTEEV